MLSFLKNLLIFSVLTILTQIGGLVYLAYKPLGMMVKRSFENRLTQVLMKGLTFIVFYTIVATIVIPIFALANAGIPIDWSSFGSVVSHPVSMGIVLGLVVGKLIGIAGFSWIAVKLGLTRLPHEINFKHIIGVSLMGGIGFTMSIFIAELGFAHHAEDLLMAKTGVLLASILAGVSGFLWLYLTTEKREK